MKIAEILEKLLADPNVTGRVPIYEKYDKNVQGNTAVERGSASCAVCVPFQDMPELPEEKACIGVAIATGGNPYLAKICARTAAVDAIAQATLKVAATGATPLTATDCLNFGNPERPGQMGQFVEAIEGLKEVCKILEIPIVSGNVSFYNEYSGASIPPSALVSVLGRVDDPATVPPRAFQNAGDTLFLIGKRHGNLGGSALLRTCNQQDTHPPQINLSAFKTLLSKVQKAANTGLFSSVNVIGQGGAVIAVLQSALSNPTLGAQLNIPEKDPLSTLFGEDPGLVISTSKPKEIQKYFGEDAQELGSITNTHTLEIQVAGEALHTLNLQTTKKQWEAPLREIF